jgi:hypothetical protein
MAKVRFGFVVMTSTGRQADESRISAHRHRISGASCAANFCMIAKEASATVSLPIRAVIGDKIRPICLAKLTRTEQGVHAAGSSSEQRRRSALRDYRQCGPASAFRQVGRINAWRVCGFPARKDLTVLGGQGEHLDVIVRGGVIFKNALH